MVTVYGLKNCDSCRKARKFLKERDIHYTFHDVRTDGVDIQMLERWADRVGWEKLVNKKSLTWRTVPEKARQDLNRNKALALILSEPTLLKRPVLEGKDFTAIGFSEKRFTEYLGRST